MVMKRIYILFIAFGIAFSACEDRFTQVVEIEIPAEMGRFKTGYLKHARRQAMTLPIIGVSVGVLLDKDVIADARIALTVAAPTPIRVRQAEDFLKGKAFNEDVLKAAGEIASSPECCMPRDSLRCEGWYREEMVRTLIPRVAMAAVEGGKP